MGVLQLRFPWFGQLYGGPVALISLIWTIIWGSCSSDFPDLDNYMGVLQLGSPWFGQLYGVLQLWFPWFGQLYGGTAAQISLIWTIIWGSCSSDFPDLDNHTGSCSSDFPDLDNHMGVLQLWSPWFGQLYGGSSAVIFLIWTIIWGSCSCDFPDLDNYMGFL